MGHLKVTIGHLRVTVGHLRVTMAHLRLTIGYVKATVVHIRVTTGHLKVTISNFFSELHPKVRPTCLCCYHIFFMCPQIFFGLLKIFVYMFITCGTPA